MKAALRHLPVRPPSRGAGFTLVELMLAVAVLAVLVAIAFNSWNAWRTRANNVQATNDIVAIAAAIDQTWQDTGAFPADLASIGRGALRDPWGHAYRYLVLAGGRTNGQARKDHALVPLNTDYDLYSMGADGASSPPLTARSSQDDILRANNGQFIGPAANY